MSHPTCAICGQPADVHETAIEGGSAVTRPLCRHHAEALTPPAARPDPARLPEVKAWLDTLSNQEKADLAEQHRLARRAR